MQDIWPREEILSTWSRIMCMSSRGIGQGLKDGERRLRVSQRKSGLRHGFLVCALVYIMNESLEEGFLARLGFHVDVVGFAAGGVF